MVSSIKIGLQGRPIIEGLLNKVLEVIADVAGDADAEVVVVGRRHRRQEVEDVVVVGENVFHLHHFGRQVRNEEEPVAQFSPAPA